MNKVSSIIFAIMCLVLGVALSIQFKSTNVNMEKAKLEMVSRDQLYDDLLREREKADALTKQLDESDKKLRSMMRPEANNNTQKLMEERLKETEAIAGLTELSAEGVIVTIDETSSTLSGLVPSDLLLVLNDLRSAGAYALCINGERVMATTEVTIAGPYMVINKNRHSAPFTIKALGKPDTLEAALKFRNGTFETFTKEYGLLMTVERSSNVTVPKFTGAVNRLLIGQE